MYRSWKKQYCGLKAHRSERHRTRALQENQWWNRRKFDIFDFQNNTHKIRASTTEAEIREDQQKKKCGENWKPCRLHEDYDGDDDDDFDRGHTAETQHARE